MKIVQSYWSKPSNLESALGPNNRFYGGWPNEKYHAISWAFSSLQLSKFYSSVELYTDKEGANWLIDKCCLSYSDVKIELDCLNEYDPLLWAVPKIYTYSRQSSSFLHIDGDVFIWQPFPYEKITGLLVAQNVEQIDLPLSDLINKIQTNFSYVPDSIKGIGAQKRIVAVNAGVLGATNINFIINYTQEAFKLIQRNRDCINSIDKGLFNNIFEQLLFYSLSQEQNIPINTLVEEVDSRYSSLLKLNTVPQYNSYVHMVGYAKQNLLACLQMEAHFKYLYPKHYQHICNIYKEKKIYPVSKVATLTFSHQALSMFQKNMQLSSCELDFQNPLSIEELGQIIETTLLENFGDDRLFLLSDIYQLERGMIELKFPQEPIDISALYRVTVTEFLNIPVQLNPYSCRAVYLYHTWSQKISFEEIELALNNKIVPQVLEVNQCYLLSKGVNNTCRLEMIKGWQAIIYELEEEACTGYELMERIQNSCEFIYEGNKLEQDIYDFLTFQLFALQTIRIAPNFYNYKSETFIKNNYTEMIHQEVPLFIIDTS